MALYRTLTRWPILVGLGAAVLTACLGGSVLGVVWILGALSAQWRGAEVLAQDLSADKVIFGVMVPVVGAVGGAVLDEVRSPTHRGYGPFVAMFVTPIAMVGVVLALGGAVITAGSAWRAARQRPEA